jgi:hypothetical protein
MTDPIDELERLAKMDPQLIAAAKPDAILYLIERLKKAEAVCETLDLCGSTPCGHDKDADALFQCPTCEKSIWDAIKEWRR